jgi:superfamily II DNA or RNA helicase
MRIVCSTHLSNDDIALIKSGYEVKTIFEKNLSQQIELLLLDKDKPNVKNLSWLIKNNRLDIKVCIKDLIEIQSNDNTIFHEKFGVFKDSEGNIVSFLGSVNESLKGWMFNEESFEVSYSWEDVLKKRVQEKVNRFERLWDGVANQVTTYEFPIALKEKLLNIAPQEPINAITCIQYFKTSSNKFTPRECQLNAFNKFKESNFICMYQMATGSGKTKAALYSFSKTTGWKILLILVPGIDLVLQWGEEAKQFFPDKYLIKCGSDFSKWKERLRDLIQAKIPEKTIVISTYDSAITDFSIDKWSEINSDIFGLICDEAHNLGGRQTQKIMTLKSKYRIGLTATPTRNFDEEGTDKILNFFNHNAYEFPIKKAIDQGYLVEYEYTVSPCSLDDEEWDRYIKLSNEISKIKTYVSTPGESEDSESQWEKALKDKYMLRGEILKIARNKLALFPSIIKDISRDKRLLIYADSHEHLAGYAQVLDDLGRNYFIYTGDKDSKTVRPKMLEEFKLGVRKILLAIDCLDEGVDIPCCDAAIFISSSTSERQFIQRRGRVLRKSIGKHRAYVYDYFVIPPFNPSNELECGLAKQLVSKEYRRINIIAGDAINGTIVKNKLDEVLETNSLGIFNF